MSLLRRLPKPLYSLGMILLNPVSRVIAYSQFILRVRIILFKKFFDPVCGLRKVLIHFFAFYAAFFRYKFSLGVPAANIVLNHGFISPAGNNKRRRKQNQH